MWKKMRQLSITQVGRVDKLNSKVKRLNLVRDNRGGSDIK